MTGDCDGRKMLPSRVSSGFDTREEGRESDVIGNLGGFTALEVHPRLVPGLVFKTCILGLILDGTLRGETD